MKDNQKSTKQKVEKVDLSKQVEVLQNVVPILVKSLFFIGVLSIAFVLHLYFFHAFFSVVVLSVGIACLLGAFLLMIFNKRNFNTSKISMLGRITALEKLMEV